MSQEIADDFPRLLGLFQPGHVPAFIFCLQKTDRCASSAFLAITADRAWFRAALATVLTCEKSIFG